MLSASQPRISLPAGDDTVTLHYDSGSSCPQFFDIVYSVESRGQLFQVGNVTHPPGERGSVTVQLLGGGSDSPYVFTVSTHPAGAPPQGQPCPGWTIEVDPQSATAPPAATPSQSG